jgi:hypothetical protein
MSKASLPKWSTLLWPNIRVGFQFLLIKVD